MLLISIVMDEYIYLSQLCGRPQVRPYGGSWLVSMLGMMDCNDIVYVCHSLIYPTCVARSNTGMMIAIMINPMTTPITRVIAGSIMVVICWTAAATSSS